MIVVGIVTNYLLFIKRKTRSEAKTFHSPESGYRVSSDDLLNYLCTVLLLHNIVYCWNYSYISVFVNMSSHLEELRQLLASTEGPSRKALLRELYEIILSVETPEDTAKRM